ncbi:MAG TPA: carboxypeptidase regulatory-like domain-containing protein, partial [Candidatus Latescibacteria bacterium]|nr:carboxypeptidase regulatory-like domain-containing protein [Candidatus Latescibacterota bacterium]
MCLPAGLCALFLILCQVSEGWSSVNAGLLKSQANLSAGLMLTEVPLGLVAVSDTVSVRWEPQVEGTLRYGPAPGGAEPEAYPFGIPDTALAGREPGLLRIPGAALPAGVFYCVVQSVDLHSVEFVFIREAETSPRMIAPKTAKGEPGIPTATPTFTWESVPGVPFYHIILSDQPFVVEKDENGRTVVKGANVIWQAITPETSIPYGTPDPSGFFSDIEAPPLADPLVRDVRYNWIVLNNYGNNPALTSDVTSGPAGFTVDVPAPFEPPRNLYPEPSAIVTSQVIPFSWSSVPEASTYHLYLSRREEVVGNEAFIPVWDGITTEPTLEFDASLILQDGWYVWKVLAKDERGGGAMGDTTGFYYISRSSEVHFETYELSPKKSHLPRVNLVIESLGGGMNPFPVATGKDKGFLDRDLPLGEYKVWASKEGYEDTTVAFSVEEEGKRVTVRIYLRPSPSKLSGVTRDNEGVALGFVEVTAERADTAYSRSTTSDQNGHFLLSVSPGVWTIRARKPGYDPPDPIEVSLSPGQEMDLGELILTLRRYRLEGRVTTPGGDPIWNATVVAEGEGSKEITITDGEGRYGLRLSPGTWKVTAHKDGYTSLQPTYVEVIDLDRTLDFELVPRANLLTGQVTSDGRPLELARVVATPSSGAPVEVLTNSKGEYRLSLPEGDYIVRAEKEGYVPSKPKNFSLGLGQTVGGVHFDLEPQEVWVEGRTTLPDGTPLAGVRVEGGGTEAVSDEDGSYRLGLMPGTYTLRASKEGYISPEPVEVVLGPGESVGGVDFILTPNASVLKGSLRSSGLSVVEALVEAYRDGNLVAGTRTGEGGEYTLNVPPGGYVLRAFKEGFVAEPESLEVAIAPGQARTGLDFELKETAALVQGVVSSPGGPIRKALVRVYRGEELVAETQTTSDGLYTLKLPSGYAYSLEASKRGYLPGKGETEALSPGDEVSLDFLLTPQQSLVIGVVRDTAGTALGDVKLKVEGVEETYTARTGADGRFSLGVEAGGYSLVASKSGYIEQTRKVEVALGDTVEVEFVLSPSFGTIDGYLTDRRTGDPVADALVRAVEVGSGIGAMGKTDDSGFYEFPGLVPGVYTVSATHPAYRPEVWEGEVLPPSGVLHIDFQLKPAEAHIYGTCRSEGDPVAGATVVALDSLGRTFAAVSDDEGNYTLEHLLPGTYRVSAGLTGYRTEEGEVAVALVESARADFSFLPNDGSISGWARDEGGRGMGGVPVVARGQAGNEGRATTEEDGSFHIPALAPDTYTVTASLPGYAPAEATLTVDPGQDVEGVELALERNTLTLSGSVQDQRGRPLPGVSVEALAGGERRQARTDEGGTFSFLELPRGPEVRLRTVMYKQGYDNADTTVSLGEEDHLLGVVLTVVVHRGVIRGKVGVPGAEVTAKDRAGRLYRTFSDAEGTYALTNLYVGEYTVTARKTGYTADLREARIAEPDQELSLDLILSPVRVAISGLVKSSSGRPVPETPLIVWSTEGRWSAQTGPDGSFRVEDLPPNLSYTVGTHLPPEDFDNADTTLKVGAEDVEVILLVGVHNGVVRGRVSEADGDPLMEARVYLAELDTVLHVDQDGSYVPAHLPPGEYTLRATAPAYLDSVVGVNLEEFDSLRVDFQLRRMEQPISGSVVFEGRGVGRAIVSLFRPGEDVPFLLDTTDAAGAFGFSGLEEGEYRVKVEKRGFRAEILPRRPGPEPVAVELAPRDSTIFGTVVWKGGGVVGAHVVARALSGWEVRDTTDIFGDFCLGPLPEGTYSIVAEAENLASPARTVVLEEGGWTQLKLELARTAEVRGEVSDLDGNPVPAAQVVATHSATGWATLAFADSSGRYELKGLMVGKYTLTCRATGYKAEVPYISLELTSGDVVTRDFAMRPLPNLISGRIVDRNLKPLAGAVVAAVGDEVLYEARTDREGRYRIEEVPSGEYRVDVRLFGYRSPGARSIRVSPGRTAILDFTMEQIRNCFRGIVIDGLTGEPLPGVLVVASSAEGTFVDTTDVEGRYLLPVLPGAYAIRFEKEGYQPKDMEAVLTEGGIEISSPTLERQLRRATLEVRVVKRGQGMGEVQVVCLPQVEGIPADTALTAPDGSSHFDLTIPAPYRISAYKEGIGTLRTPTFELKADTTYILRYPGGEVKVRPAEGAWVRLSGPGFEVVLSEETGWETADTLRAGRYKVEVEVPDTLLGPEPFEVTLGEDEVR